MSCCVWLIRLDRRKADRCLIRQRSRRGAVDLVSCAGDRLPIGSGLTSRLAGVGSGLRCIWGMHADGEPSFAQPLGAGRGDLHEEGMQRPCSHARGWCQGLVLLRHRWLVLAAWLVRRGGRLALLGPCRLCWRLDHAAHGSSLDHSLWGSPLDRCRPAPFGACPARSGSMAAPGRIPQTDAIAQLQHLVFRCPCFPDGAS